MTFKLLFSLYIAFLSVSEGFLNQDAYAISLNNEISAQSEVSELAVPVFVEHKQESDSNKNCPDPEDCRCCHKCFGHCGALLSSFNIEQSEFSELILSSSSKTLVYRDLDSLFRPPILS